MSAEVCTTCRRPKASIQCEICQEPICRGCEQFLTATSFAFLKKVPEELAHAHYCQTCHAGKVEPALESYNEVLGRAKEVFIFFTTQKRIPPILKKSQESVRVDSCEDRDETILRLAFFTAEQGYNSLINTEVTAEKIRNAGYQKSRWRGVGVPATIDAEKFEREEEFPRNG